MTPDLPSSLIAGISFIGRSGGQVKTLSGFKKGHHSVPDAANATTNAFLGKLCASELEAQAENLFQAVRTGLGYKRKEISLSVTSPTAVLTAKDFVFEIGYALEENDPAHYAVTNSLHGVKSADLAWTEEFDRIFGGMFGELSFGFRKSANVEAIIDVIENLDGADGIGVSYPSDCRECFVSVDGVDAQVRCTSDALGMVFARAGSPRELLERFAEVRAAFAISRELAGIIA
jgi:hypothetical protein